MGVSMGDIVATMRLDISQFNANLNTVSAGIKGLGSSEQMSGITNFSKTIQSAGVGLTKGLTVPIVGVGAASVKVAADFESSMSKVQSASGASNEEMAKLEKVAREMGSSTVYSAKESADALYYMGLAGWDTTQMTEGLAPVLYMAGSAGIELGRASEIVTDTLNMFSMGAEDAGRLTDVLAQTAATTSTDINGLGDSLTYCGTGAAAMGYDVEEVSAILGVMGDAGIKGTVAGTTLNSMFKDMKKSAKDGAIAIGDTSVKIVDAQGNYRSMVDILADVETATEGMTMEQKNQALSSVWQVEAQKGVNAIMEQGVDKLKDVDGALRDCTGAAKEQYEVMQDNLKGTWANLSSELEDIGITIGNLIIPYLEKLMDAAMKAVRSLNDFMQAHPTLTTIAIAILGIVAAVGPVLVVLGTFGLAFAKVFDGIKFLMKGFGLLKTAFLIVKTLIMDSLIPALGGLFTFLMANPIVLVIAAVAALVAGFIYLWNNCEGFREFWINLWETVKTACTEAWNSISQWFITTWTTLVNIWQGLPEFFGNLWDTVKTKVSEVWENIKLAIQTACTNIGNFFTVTIPQWIANIGQWFSELPYKIGFALGTVLGTIVQWGLNAWNYLVTNVPLWINAVVTFFSELPGKIANWLTVAIDNIKHWGLKTILEAKLAGKGFIDNIVTFFSELPSKIANFLTIAIQKMKEWVTQMVQKAIEVGTKVISNIISFYSQLPGKIWNFLSQAISKMATWVTQMAGKAKEAASKTISNITSGLAGLPGKLVTIGKNALQGLWNGMSSVMNGIKNKVKSFCDGLVAGFKKVLHINSPSRVMRDQVGKSIGEGIIAGMDAEENSVLKTAEGMANNLIDTMSTELNPNLVSNVMAKSNTPITSANKNTDTSTSKNNDSTSTVEPINIYLNIDNFNNQRSQDVKDLMSELVTVVKDSSLVKKGTRGLVGV